MMMMINNHHRASKREQYKYSTRNSPDSLLWLILRQNARVSPEPNLIDSRSSLVSRLLARRLFVRVALGQTIALKAPRALKLTANNLDSKRFSPPNDINETNRIETFGFDFLWTWIWI